MNFRYAQKPPTTTPAAVVRDSMPPATAWKVAADPSASAVIALAGAAELDVRPNAAVTLLAAAIQPPSPPHRLTTLAARCPLPDQEALPQQGAKSVRPWPS